LGRQAYFRFQDVKNPTKCFLVLRDETTFYELEKDTSLQESTVRHRQQLTSWGKHWWQAGRNCLKCCCRSCPCAAMQQSRFCTARAGIDAQGQPKNSSAVTHSRSVDTSSETRLRLAAVRRRRGGLGGCPSAGCSFFESVTYAYIMRPQDDLPPTAHNLISPALPCCGAGVSEMQYPQYVRHCRPLSQADRDACRGHGPCQQTSGLRSFAILQSRAPTSFRRWWPSFQTRCSERVRLPMGLMVTSSARSMVSGMTK
jgi:hypothetical protein